MEVAEAPEAVEQPVEAMATEPAEGGGDQVVFFMKVLKTGRVVHHFGHNFYRFDRNLVKPSGRAYFSCSVRKCGAR